MRLQITHDTVYDYSPAVETAQHMVYLTPLDSPTQRLLEHRLDIQPRPETVRVMHDVFGNTRGFFSLQLAHRQLHVQAFSQVQTQPSLLPDSRIAWELVRERFRYNAGSTFDAANEFVFPSSMVPCQSEFAQYARPSFATGVGLLAAAVDLMNRIHREFTYESQSTEINTPALQALQQRKGVCQDFAHIFVACLRALGLAARYVSGYLLTVPAPGALKLRGSDASHAWASVYVPDLPEGQRWVHLDPTNDRAGWHSPGEDYVVLAVGRDFSDVSPMRGVIHGGANHILTVGVTVEPMTATVPEPASRDAQFQTQSRLSGSNQSQSQSQSQS
ncbi:MAG: transglutaminase family protein [Rhodoferax sp.]|uniref:transglutaminase family protein n=1 Tax=Rhodoferax sp. TaxID=50421 RepID=UPI001B5AE4BA|nr:transglutaminase family protein [Rhodoferax sp.]MBP9906761.1 transglutaminase family protein [Rhodoferax sp.]